MSIAFHLGLKINDASPHSNWSRRCILVRIYLKTFEQFVVKRHSYWRKNLIIIHSSILSNWSPHPVFKYYISRKHITNKSQKIEITYRIFLHNSMKLHLVTSFWNLSRYEHFYLLAPLYGDWINGRALNLNLTNWGNWYHRLHFLSNTYLVICFNVKFEQGTRKGEMYK